jgi:hypothetical protein
MLEYVKDWLARWLADESLCWQQLQSALTVLPSIDHLSPLDLLCSWGAEIKAGDNDFRVCS